MARKKCSNIGGQAVLEGVMMRGTSVMATAVRDPYGNIQVESQRFKPFKERSFAFKVPFLRGILNFFVSMTSGMKTLMRSTEVFGDDMETVQPSKFEKWAAKTLKTDVMHIAMAIGLVLGLLFAVGLFILLPTYATKWIYSGVDLTVYPLFMQSFIPNITSGAIKIFIFVCYILLVSLMKDINRLFRYHGAEHKTISAYEHDLELTVENVQTMKTAHDRCGSTFIVIVLVFSIIILSVLPWFEKSIYNFLLRLAALPFIVGISYELLKVFAKFDNILTKILKAPGLLLQKLTVKQPDDKMVEVAIAAFKEVLALEADPNKETSSFCIFTSGAKAINTLARILESGQENNKEPFAVFQNQARLILINVLSLKKFSDLTVNMKIPADKLEIAKEIAQKRKQGMPLQYAIGKTNFYGFDFIVDKRVLIPRFDTEILAERAIDEVKSKGENVRVLDICTGSGAIGITIQLSTDAVVTLSDISQDALDVAKENAEINGAKVTIIQSDMFQGIEGKFDIITANPPYVSKDEIIKLPDEIKNYEPIEALNGGDDGLDYYRQISQAYEQFLLPGGLLIMEVGLGQMDSVSKMFNGEIEIIEDYNDPPIKRVILVRKER